MIFKEEFKATSFKFYSSRQLLESQEAKKQSIAARGRRWQWRRAINSKRNDTVPSSTFLQPSCTPVVSFLLLLLRRILQIFFQKRRLRLQAQLSKPQTSPRSWSTVLILLCPDGPATPASPSSTPSKTNAPISNPMFIGSM